MVNTCLLSFRQQTMSRKPCLHESSNPGSTHLSFRSRTEFQFTNGCGLSQPGLQSGLEAFTLEANPV